MSNTEDKSRAPYLFLGGPWDGEIATLPVDTMEYCITLPGPPRRIRRWTYDHDAPWWKKLLGWFRPYRRPQRLVHEETPGERKEIRYIKRQVVSPGTHPGRSIPVFVEENLAKNDKWLEELPSAIVDSLWPKDRESDDEHTEDR